MTLLKFDGGVNKRMVQLGFGQKYLVFNYCGNGQHF